MYTKLILERLTRWWAILLATQCNIQFNIYWMFYVLHWIQLNSSIKLFCVNISSAKRDINIIQRHLSADSPVILLIRQCALFLIATSLVSKITSPQWFQILKSWLSTQKSPFLYTVMLIFWPKSWYQAKSWSSGNPASIIRINLSFRNEIFKVFDKFSHS